MREPLGQPRGAARRSACATSQPPFVVWGAGPAGAAAALALRQAGELVVLCDQSVFPRHKVCGEFFSPEILPVLEELGVAEAFAARRPARVTHGELHFDHRGCRFRLPETAWGLSRFAFDEMLVRAAVERGAMLDREHAAQPALLAVGRRGTAPRGRRRFGFKAHFSGSANDAVELYFFPGGYCGLCPVEDGRTNVCGLADEALLRRFDFQMDRLEAVAPRLGARLAPLERATRWQFTGPLCFGAAAPTGGGLRAGDAMRFVDPFTGSGLLAAVRTGSWAGEALAGGPDYDARCRRFYRRQISTTTILRRLAGLDLVGRLAGLLPGPLLYRLTRPDVQ